MSIENEHSRHRTKQSSVWLSPQDIEGMEHVGTALERDHQRQLRLMRTQDGRYFYELKKEGDKQAAIAILLKGVIPVCDIKRVETPEGPRFFSYVVPIKNESFTGKHTDEIEADRRVLSLLFADAEHGANYGHGLLKNIRLDEHNNAVLFDFNLAMMNTRRTKERVLELLEYTRDEHPEAIPRIIEKMQTLKQQLHGVTGKKWFDAALAHVGYLQEDYEKYKHEELYADLVRNVDVVLEALQSK